MSMTISGGIKEVELSGYKSINNSTLKFNNLNIFIGANGSGKTNYISFFQMMNYYLSNENGLSEFVGRHGGAEYLMYFGTRVTDTIKAKLIIHTERGENEYSVELGAAIGDSLYFKDEKIAFLSHSQKNTRNRIIPLGAGGKSSRLLQIGKDDSPYNQYYVTINTMRELFNKIFFYQFHDTTPDAYIRKAIHSEDNSYLRSNGGNLSSFLHMLKKKSPKEFDKIHDVVKQIAPFIDSFLLEEDYYSSYIKLKWKERNRSDYIFDIAQMSDGTLRMIALVTVLMQPNLPAVICLDEPELGLHPEAISILADLLKCASEKCQVIIATQSSSLIDYFDPEDIVVVNKVNGETSFERLEYEKYKEWLNEYSLSTVWSTNIIGGRPQRWQNWKTPMSKQKN